MIMVSKDMRIVNYGSIKTFGLSSAGMKKHTTKEQIA